MSARGEAPRPNAVDPRQLRAVVRISLLTAARPALNPATGARVRSPLVAMLLFGLTVGGTLALSAGRFANLRSFLAGLFVTTFLQAAFAAGPGTTEARERVLDLIATKPIAEPTLELADLLTLAALVGFQTSAFAAPQLLAARWVFGAPWGAVALLYAASLASMLVAVTGWRAVVVFAASRLPLEKVRRVNLLLLFATVALATAYSVGLQTLPHDRPVSLDGLTWVRWLPPVWFADAAAGGLDATTNLERLGAALALAGTLTAFRIASRRRSSTAYAESASAGSVIARLSLSARLVDALRRALDRQTYAVGRIVLIVMSREETARYQMTAARIMFLTLAAAAFVRDSFRGALLFVGLIGYVELATAVRLAASSSKPEAAWLFSVCPADPLRIVRGVRLAVLARAFPLAGSLALVGLVVAEGAAVGALLTLCLFLQARCFTAIYLALAPAAPLARDFRDRTGTVFPTAVFQAILAVTGGAGYALVTTAARSGSPGALALVAVGLPAALALLDIVAMRRAARGLARHLRLGPERPDARGPGPLGRLAPASAAAVAARTPVAVLGGAAFGAALFAAVALVAEAAFGAYGVDGAPSVLRWALVAFVLWSISIGLSARRRGRPGRTQSEVGRAAVLTSGLVLVWLGLWLFTPRFYLAAARSGPAAVGALRLAGLDIDAANGRTGSALAFAALSGDTRAVEALLDNGARPDGTGDELTPLGLAAASGDAPTIGLLLERGAAANRRDAHGRTAYMQAAMAGNVDAMDELVRRGADESLTDDDGRTAADYFAQYEAASAGHAGSRSVRKRP